MALVLWHGDIGGAEVFYAALASSMRKLGVDAQIVFVTYAGPLAVRLANDGIPVGVLGFRRGRDILRHPRRYSEGVAAYGRDGVLLPECGFVGAALRLGGYRGRTVAVEHGALLLEEGMGRSARLARRLSRILGAWTVDVEVGVSDFMVERLRAGPHARRVYRIYNGIDPDRLAPTSEQRQLAAKQDLVVGFAGRLIPGKGADDAILAVAEAARRAPLRLLIAGDGPERSRLESLTRSLGMSDRIEFRGLVMDMQAFWNECDIGVFSSNQFTESFGIAALEAMACGKPVVATRNGAAGELVINGVTGSTVPRGDIAALTDAFTAYAERPTLRRDHGAAGRARAVERFHIDDCAQAYLRCLGLVGNRQ